MDRLVEVTDVILRDAHQSLIATRMAMEDMVPVCTDLDQAGYWSLECWGGATFDACIRFLNEDPWERLRTFKSLLPSTRTQMLLRGQNLLGYRHYEDTVVDKFVEKAAVNGMDVFRVFDALNDPRNLTRSIQAVKRTGKHAQGTICYTVSPVHSTAIFVDMAQQLVEMGVDSICLKDMAALLKPQAAYDIVKGIKERCGKETLVHVHVHSTTGVTLVSLMKAIEAGADIVDTSVSAMSLGPGHNPTESLVEMLKGTGYTTRLDLDRIYKVRDHFKKILPRYKEFQSDFSVETEIFQSQIPGGMLSNMESQLKQQGQGDKIQEVFLEVPRVRKDAGYVPLVTPSSQIVGTQAVFNVMMGDYKVMTGEFADLMLGYYGRPAFKPNTEVIEKAKEFAKKEPITCRPADLLAPEWDKLDTEAKAVEGHNGSVEDTLTYALFPGVAPKFFRARPEGPLNLGKDPSVAPAAVDPSSPAYLAGPINYEVIIDGQKSKVTVAPA